MDGWQAIVWSFACAAGVLLFLTLVANALASASVVLDQLRARERKAQQDHQAASEPVVAQAVE